MKFNLWLGISQQAIDEYKVARSHVEEGTEDEYSGPMNKQTYKILRKIHGLDAQLGLFKSVDHQNGKTYRLISLWTEHNMDIGKVRANIQYLEDEWPAHFQLLGIWGWDGLQCGQSRDEDGNITGTPDEPLNKTQLLKFMPDVMTDPGDPDADPAVPPTFGPATELTDVHLMLGQSPRNFD